KSKGHRHLLLRRHRNYPGRPSNFHGVRDLFRMRARAADRGRMKCAFGRVNRGRPRSWNHDIVRPWPAPSYPGRRKAFRDEAMSLSLRRNALVIATET